MRLSRDWQVQGVAAAVDAAPSRTDLRANGARARVDAIRESREHGSGHLSSEGEERERGATESATRLPYFRE